MVNLLPFTVTQSSKSFQVSPPSVLYPLNASVGVVSFNVSIFAPAAYCIPPLSSSSRTIFVIGASASSSLETVMIHVGILMPGLDLRVALTSLAAFVRPGAVFLITCFKVKSAVSVATLPGLPSIRISFFDSNLPVLVRVTETKSLFSAYCFCSIVAISAALVSVSFVVYTIWR